MLGKTVWVTVYDSDTDQWSVEQDTIVQEIEYGYIIDKYNPGYALKLGQGIYLTKEEALKDLNDSDRQ